MELEDSLAQHMLGASASPLPVGMRASCLARAGILLTPGMPQRRKFLETCFEVESRDQLAKHSGDKTETYSPESDRSQKKSDEGPDYILKAYCYKLLNNSRFYRSPSRPGLRLAPTHELG